MALYATNSFVRYTSDGTTLSFTITFPYADVADVYVKSISPAKVETQLTRGIQFNAVDGVLILTAPVTVGHIIHIYRVTPLTQVLDLQSQGTVYPEDIEDALDRVWMRMQEFNDGQFLAANITVSADTLGQNIGAGGVGLYAGRSSNVLQFYKMEAANPLSISLDLLRSTVKFNIPLATNSSDGLMAQLTMQEHIEYGLLLPQHSSMLSDHETRIDNLEHARPLLGAYAWDPGKGEWKGLGTRGLGATAAKQSTGVARIVFDEAMPDTTYKVTLGTKSGGEGTATPTLADFRKYTGYVDVYLFAGSTLALTDAVDFDIVVHP